MKKIQFVLWLLIAAFTFSLLSFAAEEPKLASNFVGYIDLTKGDNGNDGLSADTAKKNLLSASANGAAAMMKDGGTLVVSGKMFVGGDYAFPKLGGTLLITSNDGRKNYTSSPDQKSPTCALKMADGVTLTFKSDTIIDDILLFQEYRNSNTIVVTDGATLVLGEKVLTKGCTLTEKPIYMSLYADEGATLIVKAGTYERVAGKGTIVLGDNVTVIENEINEEPKGEIDRRAAAANALYSLELVKGYDDSGSDFRLDNKLSRAESVVQLVRFLGVEKEALNGQYTHPFKDVPIWADKYIGYAYQHRLTSGRSATVFDPDGAVDRAQFLTLLLRAMGYSDASGDFVWSDPFPLAFSIGLTESEEAPNTFVRGDAFIACYNALKSSCKNGVILSDRLIADGAITETAYGYAKRIAAGETIVVVCVGDSITAGTGSSDASKYSYPAQLQKLLGQGFRVVNCGKPGSYVLNPASAYSAKKDMPDLWYPSTASYRKAMLSSPDIVIMMLGVNDARSMVADAAKEEFIACYNSLVDDILSLECKPKLYISTHIQVINTGSTYQGTAVVQELVRKTAEERGLSLVDTSSRLNDYYQIMFHYSSDKVHPTDETYPAIAIDFYNEVFGHSVPLPTVQKTQGDVVYVSSAGSRMNDGTSPSQAVDTLAMASAMLRDSGGTVVVCGPLEVKGTYLAECGGPLKITSAYNGADYRATNAAQINLLGNITLESEVTFENVTFNVNTSGLSINGCYNSLTIGDGVECIGEKLVSLNAGYRISVGALEPAAVSCHKDCTVRVASGKWAILRGGNFRYTAEDPIGTIDKDVQLSIYVSGGEFADMGSSACSAVGMNSCDGDVYFEISGGHFRGDVFGISRIGDNNTGDTPHFGGSMTVKITGGNFDKTIGLYQNSDMSKTQGSAKLILSGTMHGLRVEDDFKEIEYIN